MTAVSALTPGSALNPGDYFIELHGNCQQTQEGFEQPDIKKPQNEWRKLNKFSTKAKNYNIYRTPWVTTLQRLNFPLTSKKER